MPGARVFENLNLHINFPHGAWVSIAKLLARTSTHFVFKHACIARPTPANTLSTRSHPSPIPVYHTRLFWSDG